MRKEQNFQEQKIILTIIFLLFSININAQKSEITNIEFNNSINYSSQFSLLKTKGVFTPIANIKVHPSVETEELNFTLIAYEVGVAYVKEKSYAWGGDSNKLISFSSSHEWEYIAPFVTGEFRSGHITDSLEILKANDLGLNVKDYYRKIMLNIGITFGQGDTKKFFLGQSASIAVSTDFEDLFIRPRIAIEGTFTSLGLGTYVRLTNNGEKYLNNIYIDLRFILPGLFDKQE